MSTATAGAAVLLVAAVAALVRANADPSPYAHLWETEPSIALGDSEVSLSLRDGVNSGLMAFFYFFVLGLEAPRELSRIRSSFE